MLKLIISLFLFLVLLGSTAVASESIIVWSAFSKTETGPNIFIRQEFRNGSSKELQITRDGRNITPTLQMDGSIIWLAWVDRENAEKYKLRYAVLLARSLQLIETGAIPTTNDHVYSPSIVVTPEGTPWLSWTGFDGHDEEIQLAHYESGQWTPQQTLTDNDRPDARPTFSLQPDGSLLLSWQAFTVDGIEPAHRKIPPIKAYTPFRNTPSKDIIRYKKRMSKRHQFSPGKELPTALKKYRNDILMGSQVELSR